MAAISRSNSVELIIADFQVEPGGPSESAHSVRSWAYLDGSWARVDRQGENLVFVANIQGTAYERPINLTQEVDSYCDFITQTPFMAPYVRENRLHWVEAHPSGLDPTKIIDIYTSSITIACGAALLRSLAHLDTYYKFMAGHTVMVIEYINPNTFGLVKTLFHLIEHRQADRAGDADIQEIPNCDTDRLGKKMDTFLRPAHLVQKLVDRLKWQMEQINKEPPDRQMKFSLTHTDHEQQIYNCFTFCTDALKQTGINLDVLYNEHFYIPNRDVMPIKDLCKRAVREKYPITQDLQPYPGVVDAALECRLQSLKEAVGSDPKIWLSASLGCILFAPFGGATLFLLPMTLTAAGTSAYVYHLEKKVEEKKKSKALELRIYQHREE